MEPVISQAAECPGAPLAAEIVLLEKLDDIECKDADGKVQAVSRELPTGEVIHIVVIFKLTYHSLHLSSFLMEVNDSLSTFLIP